MKHPPNISVCLDIDCDIPVTYFTPSATDWFIKNVTEDDEIEYVPASLLKEHQALLAVAVEALERIKGMCDVGPTCTCGRPNGLPAVISCANSALAKLRGEK